RAPRLRRLRPQAPPHSLDGAAAWTARPDWARDRRRRVVSRGGSRGGSLGQERFNLVQEAVESYRLRIEFVAAGGERHLAVVRHRMCAQHDDRDMSGGRVALELASRFPTVHDWQTEIHEDEIRFPGARDVNGFASVG